MDDTAYVILLWHTFYLGMYRLALYVLPLILSGGMYRLALYVLPLILSGSYSQSCSPLQWNGAFLTTQCSGNNGSQVGGCVPPSSHSWLQGMVVSPWWPLRPKGLSPSEG